MPIDPRMVKWDDAPTDAGPKIDPRMVKWQDVQPSYDPTEGMSTFDKVAAGAGKAVVDTLRGAGQWLGLTDRAAVAEARALDAPLMKTTAGKIGNFGGNIAMLAPASMIPGAATVPGAAMVGAAMGAMQPSVSTGETLGNIALGGVGGAGGQLAANKLGSLAQAVVDKRAAAFGAQQAADAQKFAAAKAGADVGYVVPPADMNPGMMTEVLSGLSGKIKTAQVASARNQSVTDNLARKAIGLNAGDDLTNDVLQGIRNQAAQAYGPVKNAGTVTADKQFLSALDNIASTYQGAAKSFPGLKNDGVGDLIASLKQQQFDAGSAVDATKVLREMADKAYRSGDTGMGKAAKQASNELEGMLERHLQAQGNTEALQAFQEARKLIAKTYTVQKALNEQTGNVSAQTLAKELGKGKPLSGELRTIAQMGQAFPKATQALKEAPKATSPLDWAMGVMTSAGAQNPIPLALVGARPVARSLLLSGPMQRAALQPEAFTPGMVGLLGSEPVRQLGGTLGAGGLLSAYGGQ
jgi:hypothetical protein